MSEDDICSSKQAKQAARRIFEKYQSPKQDIGQTQISKLMKDTYKALNMDYEPDSSDVCGLLGVMDHNGDGKISIEDLENLAMKYLCGQESVLGCLKIGSFQNTQNEQKQLEPYFQKKSSQQKSQQTRQKSEQNPERQQDYFQQKSVEQHSHLANTKNQTSVQQRNLA